MGELPHIPDWGVMYRQFSTNLRHRFWQSRGALRLTAAISEQIGVVKIRVITVSILYKGNGITAKELKDPYKRMEIYHHLSMIGQLCKCLWYVRDFEKAKIIIKQLV